MFGSQSPTLQAATPPVKVGKDLVKPEIPVSSDPKKPLSILGQIPAKKPIMQPII
jgi:hypothetical protein